MDTLADTGIVQPTIELYTSKFGTSGVVHERLRLEAIFCLPALASSISTYRWINQTNQTSSPPSGTRSSGAAGMPARSDMFTPDPANEILVFNIVGGQYDINAVDGFTTTSCDLIVRPRFFADWLHKRKRSAMAGNLASMKLEFIVWDEWGPENTLALDHRSSERSLRAWYYRQCASGSRFMLGEEDGFIRVLDFNPYEVGRRRLHGEEENATLCPLESFTRRGDLFDVSLRTTLPYVERRLPAAKLAPTLPHMIFIDGERILTTLVSFSLCLPLYKVDMMLIIVVPKTFRETSATNSWWCTHYRWFIYLPYLE